ncbi:4Fe-4S dicluster domain-containing protein [Sedimentibacter sp.]|uniref:4Fe-4S dicluster domain-containing protein n=1 Tax=Sedimentibacter sp. TaxID=1960295 RepID=UPI00289A1F8A|nr:reductive dehalogenase domain-containing protein [Sedimentibacter sp.]
MNKYDERNIMFARMNYAEGSEIYNDYYGRNPHMKETDDSLRALPQMGQEGSVMYDKINSPIVDSAFRYLGDIRKYSEGAPAENKVDVDPVSMTEKIKGLAKFYNAALVGITEMKDYHYYSHRGRHAENYGEEVTNKHKYGIVFAYAMDKEMIMRAPRLSESIGVVKGYVEAATIGMVISYYIRELGYDAMNHMDGNYLVVAPLAAMDAGIGEFGRNGLIVTKKYGPCIRLGVVTTDMPLIPDEKHDFGVREFCSDCGRCARTCPGKAISKTDREEKDGVLRWKINAEECYRRWRCLGTDCAICIANCPFTYGMPEELISGIKTSGEVRERILKEFDEKYGVRPIIREDAQWLK